VLSKLLKSLFVLAALTATTQADGLVTEVKVGQQGPAVHIVIRANAAVQHRARALGKSVVVDLFPAKLGSAAKTDYGDHRGLVSGVHIRQCGDHRVRITIDTSATPSYQLTERAGSKGLMISVAAMKPVTDAQSKHRERKRVNCRFDNADLGDVLKFLANEMGRNLYIGPGVKGSVTAQLKGVTAEGAFVAILKMQETEYGYKIVEPNALVVAKPDYGFEDDTLLAGPIGPRVPKDAVRQEILLEKAPAAKVMSFLESQYKGVRFTPHPTMNGFYITGSKRDILDIKSNIPNLDRAPDVPTREVLKTIYGDLEDMKELLATWLPNVSCTVDNYNNSLILEAPLSAVQRARELLNDYAREASTEGWFTSPSGDASRSSPP
jgi:type II secretory pathway component GspD/PulD (secretin)